MITGSRRTRLGFKFVILASALLVGLGVALTGFFVIRTRALLADGLGRRGLALAQNLAANSTYALQVDDPAQVEKIAKPILDDPDVAYVEVSDLTGKILVSKDPRQLARKIGAAQLKSELATWRSLVTELSIGNLQLFDAVVPVYAGSGGGGEPERLGIVRVGLSQAGLEHEVSANVRISVLIMIVMIAVSIGVVTMRTNAIVRPLARMSVVAGRVARGDFTQSIVVESDDEIGELAKAFMMMTDNLKRMLASVEAAAATIMSAATGIGVETQMLVGQAQKEKRSIEATGESMHQLSESFRSIAGGVEKVWSSAKLTSSSVKRMLESIDHVAASSQDLGAKVDENGSALTELSRTMAELGHNIETLSDAAQQTSAAATQIDVAVRSVEQNSRDAALISNRASSDAQTLGVEALEKTTIGINRIRETVEQSVTAINRLGSRSEQVGEILTVIGEVTDQVNLLSLNAAILAAQAGENGRGFAVVADEIKRLAQRTAASTGEISDLIGSVQQDTRNAVTAIRSGSSRVDEGMQQSLAARDAFSQILASSQASAMKSQDIERAAHEQAVSVRQITSAMQRIGTMIDQIVHAILEQRQSTDHMLASADTMRSATHTVQRATESLRTSSRDIASAVDDVSNRLREIASTISDQNVILGSLEEIREIARQTLQSAGMMSGKVEVLMGQAEVLQTELRRFQLHE